MENSSSEDSGREENTLSLRCESRTQMQLAISRKIQARCSMLEAAERFKTKILYIRASRDQRCHFKAFVVSADVLVGKKVKALF
jgi:hypothetical protein